MIAATPGGALVALQPLQRRRGDLLRRARRDAAEVVDQRLRRRRADEPQDRDEHEQPGKQRQDAVVGQRRGPVGDGVVLELRDRALEHAPPRALVELARRVGCPAARRSARLPLECCVRARAPASPLHGEALTGGRGRARAACLRARRRRRTRPGSRGRCAAAATRRGRRTAPARRAGVGRRGRRRRAGRERRPAKRRCSDRSTSTPTRALARPPRPSRQRLRLLVRVLAPSPAPVGRGVARPWPRARSLVSSTFARA